MIRCTNDNCKQQYIGGTGRQMKFQIGDHRGFIQNQVTSKAKWAHWSQPGHRLADMKFTVLEQPKYNDMNYREERETFFIKKFDTFYNGINKEAWGGWGGPSILSLCDIINLPKVTIPRIRVYHLLCELSSTKRYLCVLKLYSTNKKTFMC